MVLGTPHGVAESIDPSLLLLAGTGVQDTTQDSFRLSPQLTADAHLDNTPHIIENYSHHTTHTSKDYVHTNPQHHVEHKEPAIPQQPFQSCVPTHIYEIGQRLGNRYSNSYIRCIDSILRYSSTDSWRSSLSSLKRCMSLPRSFHSTSSEALDNADGIDRRPEDEDENKPRYNPERLSEGEQMIWDELVDDVEAMPRIKKSFESNYTSLTERKCCQMSTIRSDLVDDRKIVLDHCGMCGFARWHWMCLSQQNMPRDEISQIEERFPRSVNTKDRFGNTVLHFFAASGQATLPALKFLFELGVDINAINSFGETFMHVLSPNGFSDKNGMSDYLELVTYLLGEGFNIHQQDYCGRMISDVFLTTTPTWMTPSSLIPTPGDDILNQILMLMKVEPPGQNITIESSFARPSRTLYPTTSGTRDFLNDVESYSPRFINRLISSNGSIFQGSFVTFLQQYNSIERAKDSIVNLVLRERNIVSALDSNWDTLLIAIVSLWLETDNVMILKELTETIIDQGANIHMRDRRRNTVLTIACRRGFRAVVITLLRRGANVHARDSEGRGILFQSKVCFLRAQSTGEDNKYAAILSCMTVIIGAGGKWEPTEIDEWSDPNYMRPGFH